MVFSSTIFLFAFLPVTLAGYYLLDRRFKNIFLLIMSLIFYAWGEPKFVPILLLSVLVNYTLAMLIYREQNATPRRSGRFVLIIATVFNIAVLFVFKYLNFTISSANMLAAHTLGQPGTEFLTQTNIVLPIGISFFTFHAMSYVFDVYRGNVRAQKNPMNLGLYITLFPQLVAGPIIRYKTVAEQLTNRKETLADFSEGIKRFIIGLSKKVLIANTVAIAADYAFSATSGDGLTVGLAWLGAICYALQIYFDFSGYSDMAIGLGRMFGFHFLENFDYPYASGSITEFWRRWHISLSSWFRDYVYFPLGGSRVKKKSRLVFNLLVVWLLTGIWHGANWTFIIWGLFYFALLVFEKLTSIVDKLKTRPVAAVFYRLFTLLCVLCSWVLFRSDNISSAGVFLRSMFGVAARGVWDGITASVIQQYLPIVIVAIIASVPLLKIFCSKLKRGPKSGVAMETISRLILLGIAVLAIAFTVANSYNPFIYFNF